MCQTVLKVQNPCRHGTSILGTTQMIIHKLAKYVSCQIVITAVEKNKQRIEICKSVTISNRVIIEELSDKVN